MERISYEKLKSVINPDMAVSTFEWNEMSISVKRYLDMEDMMNFTYSVFNSCFSNTTGEYRPEVKDFAIRSCILEIYANIDLPDNLAERYNVIYQSSVIPEIMQYIDQAQFNAIMIAIDNKIESRINMNVAKFENEMREAQETLSGVLEFVKEIFDGIDNETVKQIAGAISNMKISPEKLAETVVEVNARVRDEKENSDNTEKAD